MVGRHLLLVLMFLTTADTTSTATCSGSEEPSTLISSIPSATSLEKFPGGGMLI
jgi:hypothetical protein